jgi:hypothetical protein
MPFSDEGFFWYSQKQAQSRDDYWTDRPKLRLFARLDDGREVEYTHKHETKDHGCKWDDLIFLGHGTYSRSEPLDNALQRSPFLEYQSPDKDL